ISAIHRSSVAQQSMPRGGRMSTPSSKTSSEFTFIPSLILVLLHVTTGGAFPPLWKYCPSSPNSTINGSTFGTSLRLLLSSLPSNASTTTARFANQTVGDAPNRVYGLAQCRGDATGDKCLQCLNTAREDLPNIMDGLMARLISKATSVPSGAPLYATDQANFTSFRTLYGLAQCNNNILTTSDCKRCLEGEVGQIPVCCEGRQGGRVVEANCDVRFESYNSMKIWLLQYRSLLLQQTEPHRSFGETDDGRRKRRDPLVWEPIRGARAILTPPKGKGALETRGKRSIPNFRLQTVDWLDHIITPPKELSPKGCYSLPIMGLGEMSRCNLIFETVRAATDNFSEEKKLGEGGFEAQIPVKLVPHCMSIRINAAARNATGYFVDPGLLEA
ncbi:hypothetical protein ACLOJK_037501, partial [Asimina triloba]